MSNATAGSVALPASRLRPEVHMIDYLIADPRGRALVMAHFLDPRLGSDAPAAQAPQAAQAAPGPVTSWAAVARAVGVSLDTVSRRRKAWSVAASKPHFDTAADALRWWQLSQAGERNLAPSSEALHAAAASPQRSGASPARRPGRPRKQGTTGTTLADLRAARKGE